jgi:hypothetical protein
MFYGRDPTRRGYFCRYDGTSFSMRAEPTVFEISVVYRPIKSAKWRREGSICRFKPSWRGPWRAFADGGKRP